MNRVNQLVHYVTGKKDAEFIAANIPSDSPEAEIHAFEANADLNTNPRVQKPYLHAMLGLPIGETLSIDVWYELAQLYLKGMGYGGCPYLLVRHQDQAHDHVHLIIGRTHPLTEKFVDDSWEKTKSRKIIQELEQQFNLAPTRGAWESEIQAESVTMVRCQESGKPPSVLQQLQVILADAQQSSQSFDEYIDLLAVEDVEVLPKLDAESQQVIGVLYKHQDITFSASKVGKAYNLPSLEKYWNAAIVPIAENQPELLVSPRQFTPAAEIELE